MTELNTLAVIEAPLEPEMPPLELAERWLWNLRGTQQAEWPLELLPLLKLRYGGLLSPTVWSLLVRPATASGDWEVEVYDTVRGAGGTRLEFRSQNPAEVVAELLERFDSPEFSEGFGLFDPQARAIMARLARAGEIRSDEHLEVVSATARHYLRFAKLLAGHIAEEIDLKAATIGRMQSMPATGIADDEAQAQTFYDDLVDGADTDSLLHETWNHAVTSVANEVFESQPFPAQLALWLDNDQCSGHLEHELYEEVPDRWHTLGPKDLYDQRFIVEEAAGRVMGQAIADHDDKREW